jgi:hypothetical protein
MRAFAEAEVVIPDGPYAGRRFRCDRQPYTGLWCHLADPPLAPPPVAGPVPRVRV